MAHTKGPWRVGNGGCVVADHPVPGMNGRIAVEYYGGHLIAESIAPQNRPIIAAAPTMLILLKDLDAALGGWQLWRLAAFMVRLRRVIQLAEKLEP